MTNSRLHVLLLAALTATLAACSAQQGGNVERRYEDLRTLVLEQRRAIEDLQREQETMQAALDEMRFGRRPSSRPVYGPSGAGLEQDRYRQPTSPMTAQPEFPVDEPADEDPRAGDVASIPQTQPDRPAPAAPQGGSVPTDLVGTSYDSAMRSLNAGDHDEAIQSFRNFLHDNASSPYADDAQYWIGEAYFRKGLYHRAIIELNLVSTSYGSGDRAPAALLRQAEAFRIVGDRVDARLSLQKVINRYPGTDEAAKASRMLNEIGG
ncbi:MAG TPA: tol-pal system protein YbgF [Candidatus Limnocylindrales bacterium]|nr:tol-pal system protein YbgF [Candidatus Limnocylindrales bacterium]